MINSNLQKDNFIELDYSKIKDDVKYNLNKNVSNFQKPKFKTLKLACYSIITLLLCGLSSVIAIACYKNQDLDNSKPPCPIVDNSQTCPICGGVDPDGPVNPNTNPTLINQFKSSYLVKAGYLDTCMAFSSRYSSGTNYLCLDKILKTSLLSENDKQTLIDSLEYSITSYYFTYYLGIKDGKDIIIMKDMRNSPYQTYQFDSNFSYDFTSIIEEFEKLSGVYLTLEWLNGDTYDQFGNLKTGISIYFQEDETGQIREYYTAFINDHLYVVTK